MNLSRSEKKYLKKNLHSRPLQEIANHLNVSYDDLVTYLRSKKGGEKLQSLLANQPRESSPSPLPTSWLKTHWKSLILLTLLVLLTYFNSLGNAFLSDDFRAIRDNPEINRISYFLNPPYIFLNFRAMVVFITNKLFGQNPVFFRLENVFFHLSSTVLVYYLLTLIQKPPIPFFSAGLFAVHPVLSEAITWVSGGTYPFGAPLFLIAFIIYLTAIRQQIKPHYSLYFLALLTFWFAVSVNLSYIVLPLVLLVWELLLGNLKQNWKKIIPFFLAASVWSIPILTGLQSRTVSMETNYYQTPGFNNPLVQIPIAISSYLQLLLWPKALSFYHSELSFTLSEYLIRSFVLISFFILTIILLKKNRQLAFWLIFFIIALGPTLLPVRVTWIVAERYAYLASLGIIIPFAFLVEKVFSKFKESKYLSFFVFGLIILSLLGRTIIRNSDWKNQDSLWLATAKTSPSSPQNHNNLGDYYSRHGNFEKAIEEFSIAIKLQSNYGDAYHNLANTYEQAGKEDLALENYLKALSFNPKLWQSFQNIAAIYFNRGKISLAEENLKKAIEIKPENSDLYVNLAIIYLKQGDKLKAREAAQRSLQLDSQNPRAKEVLTLTQEK